MTAAKKLSVWDKPDKGRKQCPHCQKYVPSPASICPNPDCGKPIPRKGTGKGKKAKTGDDIRAAIQVVKKNGGIEIMQKQIAEVEKWVAELGGWDNALEKLGLIKELKNL